MKPSKLSFNKAFPLAVAWINGSENRVALAESIAKLLDAQAEEAAKVVDGIYEELSKRSYPPPKLLLKIASEIRSTLKGGK